MLNFPRGSPVNFRDISSYKFQALTWEGYDDGELGQWEDNRLYNIYVSGVDEHGNSVVMKTRFQPWIIVKLSKGIDAETFVHDTLLRKDEDMSEAQIYAKDLGPGDSIKKERVYMASKRGETMEFAKYLDSFVRYEIVVYSDVGKGFTGLIPKTYEFVKIYFNVQQTAKAAGRWVQNNTESLLYDSLLEPIIRLADLTSWKMAGWCEIPTEKCNRMFKHDSRSISTAQVEIHVPNWEFIAGIDSAKTADFRIVSIDLECHATGGKFPDKNNIDNPMFQCAFYTKNVAKIMLHLGPCNPLGDGVLLIIVDTVKEWIVKFVDIIVALDPDIVHAYNGFGFDFPYLAVQAKLNGCWDDFQRMSRLCKQKVSFYEKKMKSSGTGVNIWGILKMPGRFTYDPMISIKQAPKKLKSYTLNSVSKVFLSTELKPDPLSCLEGEFKLTIQHESHGFVVGDVVNLMEVVLLTRGEFEYTLGGWGYEEFHEKLHTIVSVLSVDEYEIQMSTACTQSVSSGGGSNIKVFESKHDIDFNVMNQAFMDGDAEIMCTVARYCIQDAILPQKIIDSRCIILNLLEMAKARWTPVEYVLTRGQSIGVFSQITRAGLKMGYLLPTRDYNKPTVEDGEEFVGGLVLDPVIGYHYENPTAVPDFASLYPSEICDHNFGMITYVLKPKYLNLPGVKYFTQKVSEKTSYTFATNAPCIIRTVVGDQLDARGVFKKKMYASVTKAERDLWNGAQMAQKICANSIYGVTGAKPSQSLLPSHVSRPVALATTACGREATLFARDYAQDSSNFTDVMKCTTHFPADYPFIHEYKPKKYGLKDANQIELGMSVVGTEGYSTVVGIDIKNNMYYIQLEHGKVYDMAKYEAKICYGDTDSIFVQFNCNHLELMIQKLAYTIIVSSYISKKITHQIKTNNPHTPYDEQRMDLEYEKVFPYLLLCSKKRYEGMKTLFDLFKFERSSSGTIGTRRNACLYAKEGFNRLLEPLMDINTPDKRNVIKQILKSAKRDVEDLYNGRVPLKKLCISSALNDEYTARLKSESANKKIRTFGTHNIFVGDVVTLKSKKRKKPEWKVLETKPLKLQQINNDDQVKYPLYNEIHERGKKMLKLSKIVNPETTDEEITSVTTWAPRLARKMYARDPNAAPGAGSRVEGVIVKIPNATEDTLQYERIEDPDYVRKHKLEIDAGQYVETQCLVPWGQVLDLVEKGSAERLFNDAAARYQLKISGQTTIENAFKKRKNDDKITMDLDKPLSIVKRKITRRKRLKNSGGDLRNFFKTANK